MSDHWTLCARLVEAALLGGAVGLEREFSGKPAGLRTTMLIALGSAFFTHVSLGFSPDRGGDPGRIAAQIVTGIGFLGGGAILHSRHSIHGLTSAATIWVVAAVGMAVGAGYEHHAVLATLVLLAVLISLRRMERRLFGQDVITLTASFAGQVPDPATLLQEVAPRRKLLHREWRKSEDGKVEVTISWKGVVEEAERVSSAIRKLPGGRPESWEVQG